MSGQTSPTKHTLTPKQESFCLVFIETGNASEAYRRSYSASNMKPAVINVQACKMLSSPKIAVRVNELRAELVERHRFTIDDMVKQLDEDRVFARELETPAAAISASMGKAKVLGFLKDHVEVTGNINIADVIAARRTKVREIGNGN